MFLIATKSYQAILNTQLKLNLERYNKLEDILSKQYILLDEVLSKIFVKHHLISFS